MTFSGLTYSFLSPKSMSNLSDILSPSPVDLSADTFPGVQASIINTNPIIK